jgi:hypothetical protein
MSLPEGCLSVVERRARTFSSTVRAAATRAGTPIKALQDAGGWNSPNMPLRYAESAEIANEGVRLE